MMTKQAKFNELMADFRRFAAGKRLAASRAKGLEGERKRKQLALTCVQYDGNYFNVTDSYRAIRIKSEYVKELPKDEPFLYDVRDNEIKESEYPEMSRLFPTEHSTELFIPFDVLRELRKVLEDTHKESKDDEHRKMQVVFAEGAISLQAKQHENDDTNKLRIINGINVSGEHPIKFVINSGYLKDALLTASKMRRYANVDGIKLKYISPLRPITITDDAMYEMLVIPIRTY